MASPGILPPNTKCVAIHDFEGQQPHDLSFEAGAIITLLEPSQSQFWYEAIDSIGRKGIVPITYLEVQEVSSSDGPPLPPKSTSFAKSFRKARTTPPTSPPHNTSESPNGVVVSTSTAGAPPVPTAGAPPVPSKPPSFKPIRSQTTKPMHKKPQRAQSLPRNASLGVGACSEDVLGDIDSRPPMPLPQELVPQTPAPVVVPERSSVYQTIQDYRQKSGWFSPTIEAVLGKKCAMQSMALTQMKSAVYCFQHKFDVKARYVGKSHDVLNDLTRLILRLYEKPEDKLNVLEKEMKYKYSNASEWNVRIWACNSHQLDYEWARNIIRCDSLRPRGLNERFVLHSENDWVNFCQWYIEFRKKKELEKKRATPASTNHK